jgi:hypothetical protein
MLLFVYGKMCGEDGYGLSLRIINNSPNLPNLILLHISNRKRIQLVLLTMVLFLINILENQEYNQI